MERTVKIMTITHDHTRNYLKPMGQRIVLLVLMTFGSAVGVLPVSADPVIDKSDRFIQAKYHATKPDFINVIVRIEGGINSERVNRLRAIQGVISNYLPLIRSVVLRIPAGRLKALANMPFISRI